MKYLCLIIYHLISISVSSHLISSLLSLSIPKIWISILILEIWDGDKTEEKWDGWSWDGWLWDGWSSWEEEKMKSCFCEMRDEISFIFDLISKIY